MSDLVSRVLAAIDEVEQDALAVPEAKRVWWGQPGKAVVVDDDGWVVVRPVSGYSAMHIARNDPAAVLRRCAADKRTVMDWLATTRDPYEGMGDDELHQHCAHPAYEYARTEGQRKAWPYVDDPPEENVGWELNITTRNLDAFERFDYTEERYWRRLRPQGPSQRKRQVPFYIRNLAIGYGISVQEETTGV